MRSERDAEFAVFFAAQVRAVARTVYLILQDRAQAEDVTQDAFLQLYVHWPRVSNYERPDAWVRRVAIRMAGRRARRERLGMLLMSRTSDPPTIGGPVDVDLLRAVASLPLQQRTAIVLFYYEDRAIAEVADLMDCSVAAVKVTLFRARKALAHRLGEREPNDVRP
jgi:DNA-directed RNA polymerase specialized sigma24 family protein